MQSYSISGICTIVNAKKISTRRRQCAPCAFFFIFRCVKYYISNMPCLRHSSTWLSGQMLACTSPMWAFCSRYMHKRLCPMPPPIEYGSSPAIRARWNARLRRSSQPRALSWATRLSSLTRMPIDDSSNGISSTLSQRMRSPLSPRNPSSFSEIQSS